MPELLEVSDKRLGMISLKPKDVDIIIAAKDRMVRVGDWKLTYRPLTDGALYRLFNMREDPGCQKNVLEQHPQTAQQLKSSTLVVSMIKAFVERNEFAIDTHAMLRNKQNTQPFALQDRFDSPAHLSVC